jgi:hypothetical protein
MRARLIIGGVLVAATAGVTIPALAAPAKPAAPTLPPACVLVTAPNGVQLQVGYAPNGPGDCTPIP